MNLLTVHEILARRFQAVAKPKTHRKTVLISRNVHKAALSDPADRTGLYGLVVSV